MSVVMGVGGPNTNLHLGQKLGLEGKGREPQKIINVAFVSYADHGT